MSKQCFLNKTIRRLSNTGHGFKKRRMHACISYMHLTVRMLILKQVVQKWEQKELTMEWDR